MVEIQKSFYRMISMVLVFILLLSMNTSAESTVDKHHPEHPDFSDDAIFELVSLGIIRGDENGNLRLTDEITRAEFAMIIARLIQCDNDIGIPNQFIDVPEDAQYAPAINILKYYGILSGDGNGNFRPQDFVTEIEVNKVFVSVLGYDVAAKESGGYPDGYRVTASRLGLSGTGADSPADRSFVIHRAAEALDVELLEPAYYGGDGETYEVSLGKTLRSILYRRDSGSVINEIGTVTATRGSFLGEAVPEIEVGQLMINDKIYTCEKYNPEDFFGRRVEFFAEVNKNGTQGILLGIRLHGDVDELKLTRNEIEDIEGDRIYYDNGQNKIHDQVISDNAILIKNGRRIAVWSSDTIDISNSSLTLVDNDGDSKTDVILWEDFKSTVVERVGADVVYLESGHSFDGKLTLNLKSDDDRYVEIFDSDGSVLAISDLKSGDVLSIAVSDDKEYYRVYRCNETVSGVIDEIQSGEAASDEIYYYISGVKITTEAGKKIEQFDAGDTVTLKLNYMGEAVVSELTEKEALYGWIYQSKMRTLGAASVRVLMAGTLSELEKIDDTDPDNIITTPYLRAANAGIEVFDIAAKITVDDERMTAEDFVSYTNSLSDKMMRFTCNGEGEINRVEFLARSGDGDKRYYNSYEKNNLKIITKAFGTTEETYVVCVPTNEISSERDFRAGVELDVNDQLYQVSGYDVDDETHIATAIVIYASLDADASVNITDDTEEAIAESVKYRLTEDGETALVITLWCDGVRETLQVSENCIGKFDAVREGSVFRYSLNGNDELSELILDETITEDLSYYKDGNSDSYMSLYGRVEEIEYRDLSFAKNRYVHKLTVVTDESTGRHETVDINVRNTPPMYLYDMRDGTISKITPEDIEPGEMNVFVKVIKREAKAFVFVVQN